MVDEMDDMNQDKVEMRGMTILSWIWGVWLKKEDMEGRRIG